MHKIFLALPLLGYASLAFSAPEPDTNILHHDNITGHLYVQTNEAENAILVYQRNQDGSLRETGKVATGGAGTGEFRPLHNNTSGADPLVSANSLITDKTHSKLFVVNAADNSVSSFRIDDNGIPVLLDTAKTGGHTPNTLAYDDDTRTLYVGHLYGPEHIRAMKVNNDKLALLPGDLSVDTDNIKGRILSSIALSSDLDYLIATVLAEPVPGKKGIKGAQKKALLVIKTGKGMLPGKGIFQDANGVEPFTSFFLTSRKNLFLTTYAVTNTLGLGRLNELGGITHLSLAKGDDSAIDGKPLEYCWVSLSPDEKYAYVASFGTSDITSFSVNGNAVALAHAGIGRIAPVGDFAAAAGIPTSAPVDNWASADGYLYQIYGAAGKLGAFRMTQDGNLQQVALYDIPKYSVQGITGN
ncbi:TPA: beta-propeller fold lactonase family protein [Klebsiella aerogenes]|nr:beta-propeller fold lactonase family protein [Klebsiella aerogenes]